MNELQARVVTDDDGNVSVSRPGASVSLTALWGKQDAAFDKLSERLKSDPESLAMLNDIQELMYDERGLWGAVPDPEPKDNGGWARPGVRRAENRHA